MKKLNRKGFTLVELLAVIIILAIVIGISIPAVLTTTNNAKVKAGKAAALSVADWVDRQYQVIMTGLDTAQVATVDSNFKAEGNADGCKANGSGCHCALQTGDKCKQPTTTATNMTRTITNANFIAAAGLQKSNVTSIGININSKTGKSCVLLIIPTTSDYYVASPTTCATGETNCYVKDIWIKAGAC